MPSLHIIVRRFVKFQHFIQLFGGAAVIVLCSSCEEIPSYVQNLRAGAFPWQATGSGYWKGDNGPGSAKILVYLSERWSRNGGDCSGSWSRRDRRHLFISIVHLGWIEFNRFTWEIEPRHRRARVLALHQIWNGSSSRHQGISGDDPNDCSIQ